MFIFGVYTVTKICYTIQYERRGVRIRAEHYEERNEQMNEMQRKVWAVLANMSGEAVANAITDYHGLQLVDEGFARHLVEEGICGYADVGIGMED